MSAIVTQETNAPAVVRSSDSWVACTRFIRHYSPTLVAFAASRLLICAVVVFSNYVLMSRDATPRTLLTVLTHWDGGWYMSVAQHGYNYIPGQQSNMAFFPLYPALIWLADQVIPDMRVAAVLVSNLLFLGAALFFQRLVELDYRNPRVVRASILFLMFTPVGFYFSSAYAESTFLFLAIGSLLAARKGHWLIACGCGMLLTATRNIGFWITFPLLFEYVRQMWRPEIGIRSLIHPRILLFGLIPLGLMAFMFYCYQRYGDPFAYVHASAAWGRKLALPTRTVETILTAPPFYQWFFSGAILIPITLWIVGFFLRVRPEYLVFTGLLLLTYVSANNAEGMPRFVTVLFPLYIVLGVLSVRYPRLFEPLLAASIVAFTFCTIMTANGFWIT